MSRAWFFQANPKHYDIDLALSELSEIWWRVPQYTAEVRPGDVVAIWRSGKESGVIGVARVATEPAMAGMPSVEEPYSLGPTEDASVTRVRLLVRQSPFVPKQEVAGLPGLQSHPILVAPMGTVFPIDADQWKVLSGCLAEPPGAEAPLLQDRLPKVFAWNQRAKGIAPFPGGYGGYLDSLRRVCEMVAIERPSILDLPARLQEVLGVSMTGARNRASFLRKVGVVEEHASGCRLGEWAERWLDTGDPRLIIGLLHSRSQLVGELLEITRTPRSTEELLALAGSEYGLHWDTATQINNRRGWLQSGGFLQADSAGSLVASPAGLAFLEELVLEPPAAPESVSIPELELPGFVRAGVPTRVPVEVSPLDQLLAELREAASASSDPNTFERLTRDAFACLGFEAEWLGGAGKTDVLLDAPLGKDDSYRVIVDCKTSGSGHVTDQQIDWVTLGEHKRKHDADYIAVVGPSPSGARLLDRAAQHGVTIISVDQLVGLCRLHGRAPLGVDDYRVLFEEPGEVVTERLDERSEDVIRLMALAGAILEVVRRESMTFGRLTARDTLLVLKGHTAAEGTNQAELQQLFDALASPLLGVLSGDATQGYVAASSPRVAGERLNVLAEALNGHASNC